MQLTDLVSIIHSKSTLYLSPKEIPILRALSING